MLPNIMIKLYKIQNYKIPLVENRNRIYKQQNKILMKYSYPKLKILTFLSHLFYIMNLAVSVKDHC